MSNSLGIDTFGWVAQRKLKVMGSSGDHPPLGILPSAAGSSLIIFLLQ